MQPTQANDQQDAKSFYAPSQPQFEANQQPEMPQTQQMAHDRNIEWDASEYIYHDKGLGWIALLVLIALIAVGLALWFSQWLFAVLIVTMAITFGIFAVRQPKVLHYTLSDNGLTIAGRHFLLTDFRSFGLIPDGAVFSIMLIPTKRFAPAINIYFAESDGEAITDILGDHLPMEHFKQDVVDIVMRKLRF